MSEERPKKGVYVGAPACFALELAMRHVRDAFADGDDFCSCFVVGSSLQRRDWRDIDVRMMMSDEAFERQFPGAGISWEHHPKWLLLTVAISKWLSEQTSLPIDFQFQPTTKTNENHKGPRNPVGFRVARDNA